MNRIIAVFFLAFHCCGYTICQIKSPDEFLPHKLGEHFTPHHYLVEYFKHVAQNSPLVDVIQYGETNQNRPLILAIISSEDNLKELEQIRENNLRMTGMLPGKVNNDLKRAIVWLSFSVHGNEAAGSESSYSVLYELANPANSENKEWLKNTIVIMDPSINPDGYSRYTEWVRNVASGLKNPDPNDIEHSEPWPGGRTNHYLFDLNRDWAWQTQVESRARIKVYNQWFPHVHADLHEMGSESTYYFAPASKPYHQYLSSWQKEFQTTVGKNHAKYFDKNAWVYFTKEVYDLLYPSYGDTYPMFAGGIGMTYEQGGGGRGRELQTENGEILSLKDRIAHHKTTALSTIEVASKHAESILYNFQKFYKDSMEKPQGRYKSYVLKKDKSGKRIQALATLLQSQGIELQTVSKDQNTIAFSYQKNETKESALNKGDLLISAYQPRSVMAQVLLNPNTELEDSITYDITAWSLPYAYGVEAFAMEARLEGTPGYIIPEKKTPVSRSHLYLIPWTDLESAKLASAAIAEEIDLRVAMKDFETAGRAFKMGTVLASFSDNRSMGEDFYKKIDDLNTKYNAEIISVSTGFSDSGPDLGSRNFKLIKKPKILVIMGDGVGSNDYGQIKWYFDKILNYPITSVYQERLNRVDLTKYNTLILPDGRYNLGASMMPKLNAWVSGGGKIIALEGATKLFEETEGFMLKRFESNEQKTKSEEEIKQSELAARYFHYSDLERISMSNYIPGAIFRLELDSSHPLSFGLGNEYYSLKTNDISYPMIAGAHNVVRHKSKNDFVIGYAGSKIREKLKNSVAFAVEDKGRGCIVYMTDNPLFRGFWYNGLVLFSNAVYLVN